MLMECRRYLLAFFILEDNVMLDGGDLELSTWRYNQPPKFHRIMRVDPDLIVKRKTLQYKANTAILWVNSPNAIHSVSPRSPSPYSRRLVYFSGRVGTQNLFKRGLFPLATRKTFIEQIISKSQHIARQFLSIVYCMVSSNP